MASSPIASWQIKAGSVEAVIDSLFLGCSHEIRLLPLNKKVMTILDNVLKSRGLFLLTKVHIVKAMVYPVVMYCCESWMVKKALCQIIVAFELWCWGRLLRVPWAKRRSVNLKGNQPWILTGRTNVEAEAPVFWSPDEKSRLIGKTRCWGKLRSEREVIRGWDGWMASLMKWTWTWANFGRWWGTGRPGVLQSIGLQRVRQLPRWC